MSRKEVVRQAQELGLSVRKVQKKGSIARQVESKLQEMMQEARKRAPSGKGVTGFYVDPAEGNAWTSDYSDTEMRADLIKIYERSSQRVSDVVEVALANTEGSSQPNSYLMALGIAIKDLYKSGDMEAAQSLGEQITDLIPGLSLEQGTVPFDGRFHTTESPDVMPGDPVMVIQPTFKITNLKGEVQHAPSLFGTSGVEPAPPTYSLSPAPEGATETMPFAAQRKPRSQSDIDDGVDTTGQQRMTLQDMMQQPGSEATIDALVSEEPVTAELDYESMSPEAVEAEFRRTFPQYEGPALPVDEMIQEMQDFNESGGDYSTTPPEGAAVDEGPDAYGRPDLANIGTTEDTRALQDIVDEARNQLGKPEAVTREQMQQQAAEMLKKDYAGTKAMLLERGKTGGQLLPVETIAAKTIVNREAKKALKSGDRQQLLDAIALIEAYRNTGTEQARSFANRFDPKENPQERNKRLLYEAVLDPQSHNRYKRNRLRRKGKAADADKINEAWSKKIGEVTEKLRRAGIDLNDLDAVANDPIAAAKTLHAIAQAKGDFMDKAIEWRRNQMLSGPSTHNVNLFGNFLHAGWHYSAERFTESTLSALGITKDAATFKEYYHIFKGVLPGLSRGAANFLKTWDAETPQFEQQIGVEGTNRLDDPQTYIEGRKGRIIRSAQRFLLASDDFAKTLFGTMEIGARAHRIAKAEGLEGDAMSQRMNELMDDYESDAWSQTYDHVLDLTFQQEGGRVASSIKQAALSLRNRWRWLHFFIPFVSTPVNIAETGAKKSVLGAYNLAKNAYSNYREGKHIFQGEQGARAAQQLIAWGAMTALLGLNDEDDPFITGTEAETDPESREAGYRGIGSQQIRIGGMSFDYSRVEPFATTLAILVDMSNAAKRGDIAAFPEDTMKSLLNQVKTKVMLQGISDIIRVIESREPSQSIARWSSNFTTSWLPASAFIRQVRGGMDQYYKNRRVWGDGRDWYQNLLKTTLKRTELDWINDYPIYDVYGRPAKKSSINSGPLTDTVFRILSPMKLHDARREHVADRMIINYNNLGWDHESLPKRPNPYYTLGGKKSYMTAKGYADFTRISGETARKAIESVDMDPETPTAGDMEWIKGNISEARDLAKKQLIPVWRGKKKEHLESEDLYRDSATKVLETFTRDAIFLHSMPTKGTETQSYDERVSEWEERNNHRAQWLKEHLSNPAVRDAVAESLDSTRMRRFLATGPPKPSAKLRGKEFQNARDKWKRRLKVYQEWRELVQ